MYERGFLLLPGSMEAPEEVRSWKKYVINNGSSDYAVFCNDQEFNIAGSDGYEVAIIGICLDTHTYSLESERTCDVLARLLSEDIGAFREYTDHLNGRYVIICSTPGGMTVESDACGLRTVFYHESRFVLSSHYGLIQAIFHSEECRIWKEYLEITDHCLKNGLPWPKALPADLSPYEGIRLLSANHSIDDRGRIERIWPRGPSPSTDLDSVVDTIAPMLVGQMRAIVAKYPVAMGLTWGNDTRISLAASREFKDDILYFTFRDSRIVGPESEDRVKSAEFAGMLSARESLNHKVLVLDEDPTPEELERYRTNHYVRHVLRTIASFRKEIPPGYIHVMSNLVELTRKTHFHFRNDSMDAQKKRFMQWSGYANYPCREEVEELFGSFILKNDYRNVYGYDVGELFYMEYRASQWIGGTLIQNDPAFDTFMLFNCRRIIQLGMALPDVLKEGNRLAYRLVDRLWPELLDYGLPNTDGHASDYVDQNVLGNYNFVERKGTNHPWKLESNRGNDGLYCSNTFSSCMFGFSTNTLDKGDYVRLALPVFFNGKSVYTVEIDLCACGTDPVSEGPVEYYITVGGKEVYSLNMDSYPNRLNQIRYYYKSDKSEIKYVKIGLRTKADISTRYYSGILDVKAVNVSKSGTERQLGRIYSTYGYMLEEQGKD
ncbi:MAG: hypothetical protein MJZ68_04005 [archaeon]|nr:hypothetical protein [archaeon]